MAHQPKIDQNFSPSKVTLGGVPPQAITRRQNELESFSNLLKTCEGMQFAIKKTFQFRMSVFFKCLYNDRMFMLLFADVSIFARPPFNPLTTAIGRPLFGHKSPAARARELFKASTDSASLLVDIEKKRFSFSVGVFWR